MYRVLNDLEGAYWMGTEIGQLGAYSDTGNLERKARANACESVERMKARVQTDLHWEG